MTNNTEAKNIYTEAMGFFVAENYEDAIHLLGEALAEDGTFTLALVSRGAAHMRSNHPVEAIADFNRALEIDGGNAKAFHLRGLAHEQNGDDTAAESDFDKAIELDPEYGAAYFSRATLLTKRGHEDQAVEDMQMVAHLTERNVAEFANENNVWRSQHLRVEAAVESELIR